MSDRVVQTGAYFNHEEGGAGGGGVGGVMKRRSRDLQILFLVLETRLDVNASSKIPDKDIERLL